MEKILIAYPADGRQTAASIQAQIKSKGYKSTLGAVKSDLEKSQPLFVIAVITAQANSDEALISLLDECGRRNINVVLFVTEGLGKSLTSNFYMDEHVWIDSVGRSISDSMGDLVDCLKLNSDILSAKAEKKSEATKRAGQAGAKPQQAKNSSAKSGGSEPSSKEKLFKNIIYICLAVIAVLLFVLMKGGMKQTNREAANQQANVSGANGGNPNITIQLDQNLRKSESALVGSWVMTDYSDNQFKATREDSLMQQQLVNQILNKAQLVFKADKTFQRLGFSVQTETGSWEYDPQSRYLKLQPTGVNQYDVVQVQDVSSSTLVIVVQENVEQGKVLTKMTFTKIM